MLNDSNIAYTQEIQLAALLNWKWLQNTDLQLHSSKQLQCPTCPSGQQAEARGSCLKVEGWVIACCLVIGHETAMLGIRQHRRPGGPKGPAGWCNSQRLHSWIRTSCVAVLAECARSCGAAAAPGLQLTDLSLWHPSIHSVSSALYRDTSSRCTSCVNCCSTSAAGGGSSCTPATSSAKSADQA